MACWAKLWTKFVIYLTVASTCRLVCGRHDEKQSDSQPQVNLVDSFQEDSTNDQDVFAVPDHNNIQGYSQDHNVAEDQDEDYRKAALLSFATEGGPLPPNRTTKSPLLLVSTLDGTVSALDASGDGAILWKLETGPGSLLSSSISELELNSRGKPVRLIPSLDGGLYKFDGENIEPVPISADSFWTRSFEPTDDLSISGGKEVRTYGVDARTGRLQYLCSAGGCHSEPAEAGSSGEFLVIRRHSQIVRASEPDSGAERWNFSVGRLEASLLYKEAESFASCQARNGGGVNMNDPTECLQKSSNSRDVPESVIENPNFPSMEFKVVVPDGVVCAVHPQRKSTVLWTRKFESPVVHVWQLINGELIPVDLFNANFVPALEDKPSHTNQAEVMASPLLYVGIYNRQLYVQESPQLLGRLNSVVSEPDTKALHFRPSATLRVPLEANSLAVYHGRPGRFTVKFPSTESTGDDSNDSVMGETEETETDSRFTALSLRDEDNPFAGGLYLFGDEKSESGNGNSFSQEESSSDNEEFWEGGRDTTVHIVIVSLWFWWREVFLISLVTALSFHLIITRQVVYYLQRRWEIDIRRHVHALLPSLAGRIAAFEDQRAGDQAPLLNAGSGAGEPEAAEQGAVVASEVAMQSVVIQPSSQASPDVVPSPPTVMPYVSRYLTDFEPIQCLGRGGFGLVFEVRNRLDDCHYAVKRIQLPNSEEAREKVMREVKALAKLDNPHIVRYFHAWIECPPPGWQESQDAAWIDSENLTGPTPYNTGEDVSVSKTDFTPSSHGKGETLEFCLSNNIESLDMISRRRKFLDDDSSFDIVFERSSGNRDPSQSDDLEEVDNNRSSRLCINGESSDDSFSDVSEVARKSMKQCAERPRKKPASQPKMRSSVSDAKMFLFIQMQLCRKESLREWLRAHVSHRDTYQVLHMFNEIVRAVEYVHLQGLIHRDLKPSNIFFAPDGAIKIGDFGLVTAMAEEAYFQGPMSPDGTPRGNGFLPYQRTHTDQVGTQMYMSPEQIEGKPYNHKVDIYSLGLIFVELLWPLATQMEQVTVISQLRKLKLPLGFEEKYAQESVLLRKMLSTNPDERPTTFGIRASPPLASHQDPSIFDIPEYLHYNLSRPRSSTRTSSTSSS